MSQKEAVVEHFEHFAEGDKWSRLYDDRTDPVGSYNFVVRQMRVEELSHPCVGPGVQVLDVGCGTGVSAPYYIAKGCTYQGIDISPQMVEQARQREPNERASFAVGDIERGLTLADGRFDLVIALGLLEYLDELDRTAAELVRVLRPGGTLIVSVPQRGCFNHVAKTVLSPVITNAWAVVKRLLGRKAERHNVRHRRFTPRQLDRLFAAHGCTRTGQAYYNLEVLFYPFHRMLPKLSYRIKRRVERHQGSWMHVFATGYIIRCQKGGQIPSPSG